MPSILPEILKICLDFNLLSNTEEMTDHVLEMSGLELFCEKKNSIIILRKFGLQINSSKYYTSTIWFTILYN